MMCYDLYCNPNDQIKNNSYIKLKDKPFEHKIRLGLYILFLDLLDLALSKN